MAPIRVLIADDSAEFRRSVRMMLALYPNIQIVGMAHDGLEAVQLAQQSQPDLAIMDINMPKVDGITAIRGLAKVSPNTVCMIMSSEGERDMLRKAMSAGVREYLLKPFTADEFEAALKKVAAQAIATRQQAQTARTAELERDRYLTQLTMAYLRTNRMDDDAAKVYAELVVRPGVDPNLLARLAEIFCARRDWSVLKIICERMEKLTAVQTASPPARPNVTV
jgi:YesN/AraC family two-component response regulator